MNQHPKNSFESVKPPRRTGRRLVGAAGLTMLTAYGCVGGEAKGSTAEPTSVTTPAETTERRIPDTLPVISTPPTTEVTTTGAPESTTTTTTENIPTTTEAVEVRPTGEVEPGLMVGTASINISSTGEVISHDIYVSEISADIEHDPALSKGLMSTYNRATLGINETPHYPAVIGGHRRTRIDSTADGSPEEVNVLLNIHMVTPGDTMQIRLTDGSIRNYQAVEITAQPVVTTENGMQTVEYFNIPTEEPYGLVYLYACTGPNGDEVAAAAQAGMPIHDPYIDGGQSPSERYIVAFQEVA